MGISKIEKVTKVVLAKNISSKIDRINDTVSTLVNSGIVTALKLSSALTKDDTLYIISKLFILGMNETISLPKNSILVFEGEGKIKNGTIIGNNSTIIANKVVFDNVKLKGTWNCIGQIKWFTTPCILEDYEYEVSGIKNKYTKIGTIVDSYIGIQNALDSSFKEIDFNPGVYYVGTTLELKSEKKLVLQGESKLGLEMNSRDINNGCYIFTDKNIPILRISVVDENNRYKHSNGRYFTNQRLVTIQGGNFDVSKCADYRSNCIEVNANNEQKIWGLLINTNIIGKSCGTGEDDFVPQGTGININKDSDTNVEHDYGYVTNIKINSDIYYFGTGVKATNWPTNWCTNLKIDCNIANCVTAVDSNIENTCIEGMILAGYFFNSYLPDNGNNTALIRIWGGTDKASIGASVYDIKTKAVIPIYTDGVHTSDKIKYSNYYAIDISELESARIATYSNFKPFYVISEGIKANNNWSDPTYQNGTIVKTRYIDNPPTTTNEYMII